MKKRFLFLLGLTFALLSACQTREDTIVGEWKPDKVNVHFDENRSTPEIVKQIGEMEKQNVFSISHDSMLIFKGLEIEKAGRITTDAKGNIFLDGALFGQWKEGKIITKTTSPLGEIVVMYRKG